MRAGRAMAGKLGRPSAGPADDELGQRTGSADRYPPGGRGGGGWPADGDPGPADRCGDPYRAQPVELNEDRSAGDGLAQRVELVPVEPDPAVIGRPVMHPDHPEVDRLGGELDARLAGQMEYVAGAGNHISSCPRWPAGRRWVWAGMVVRVPAMPGQVQVGVRFRSGACGAGSGPVVAGGSDAGRGLVLVPAAGLVLARGVRMGAGGQG